MRKEFIEKLEAILEKNSGKMDPSLSPQTVPVFGKIYDENEILNLVEAASDCNWTDGRFVERFQRELGKYVGVEYAIACNSGSSANLLAVMALKSHLIDKDRRLKPGDEVITVASAFPTTVFPIIQAGAVPVFLDVGIPDYNIQTKDLERAVSDKTRAIFLAHTLGNPFDIVEVKRVADDHGLWLIEDNCDSLGSKYRGKKTGSFGDLATCSFYPAHHITTGEGGAVLTNDPVLNKVVLSLRDWGRDCYCKPGCDNSCGKRFEGKRGELPEGYDHKYVYSHLGYNLKMTDFNGAIGVAQLEKIDGFNYKRFENFEKTTKALKRHSALILPKATEDSDPNWFALPITVDGIERDKLVKYLNAMGVATRNLFAGNILRQPVFTDNQFPYRVVGSLENTDRIMRDTFMVGVYQGITPERRAYMIQSFDNFFS